jgi:hypothetical protein
MTKMGGQEGGKINRVPFSAAIANILELFIINKEYSQRPEA